MVGPAVASSHEGGAFKSIIRDTPQSRQCCRRCPPVKDKSCVGKEENFAGLVSYITGSPSASEAVLFASDIFGFKNPLLRRLADNVASRGYFVVLPDFFRGDPFLPAEGPNIIAGLDKWWVRHTPEDALTDLDKIVEEFKARGISSLGCSGFCWGAKLAALAGKDGNIFKEIVQLHPFAIEPSDYEEVKVPISVLAAPADHAEIAEPILSGRKDIESFVKIFPNVSHGWTIRYDENNLQEVAAAEEAHNDMFNWLAKFLPVTTNCPVSKEAAAAATAAEGQPELR